MNCRQLCYFATIVLTAVRLNAAPDFEREVAPILEATCVSCHNAHEAKGDLDLSTWAAVLTYDGAIVPGDPGASLLLDVVTGSEPEMPKKADPLTAEQVALLRAWIAAGAKWPAERTLAHHPKRDLDWWSLRPIESEGQKVRRVDAGNPVDAFVDEKLRQKGLRPVPAADGVTLIRRLTYDLTGLPPTPDEVDAFLKHPDWEVTVDRLLGNSAFGEKFGQHWLDLARYAETHGYDKDKPRENAWPYRDYVIRSFNEDKPFSRFVQEQVAGDVLFPGDPDGVTALGFLAAGPWDFIGHWEVGEAKLDGRIAKHLDRDEMVSAVFNVFQSTTVQCAQCHHHKFDPIRMEDYYRLHAIFAAVDRADRVYEGLPPEQQRAQERGRFRDQRAQAGAGKADHADHASRRREDVGNRSPHCGAERRIRHRIGVAAAIRLSQPDHEESRREKVGSDRSPNASHGHRGADHAGL